MTRKPTPPEPHDALATARDLELRSTSRHARVGGYWDDWFDAEPDTRSYQEHLDALLAPDDIAGRRVLDLGCGTGGFARLLLAAGARQVVGVDRSARSLALARAGSPSFDLIRMDLMHAPVLGRFDIVFAYAVLYYADDPDQALAAAASCVAAGGCLVAGVLEDNPAARAFNVLRRGLAHLPRQTWPAIGALAAVVATPLVALRSGRVVGLRRRIRRAVGGMFLPARKLYTAAELDRILSAAGLVRERFSPGSGVSRLSRHVVVRARRPR